MPSTVEDRVAIRREIIDLMNEKVKLERQLEALVQVLETHGVRMDEPLVDDQDFPRNDIDVYQIRQTRTRIICTRNDLRTIMERIEKRLNDFFALINNNEPTDIVNGHCALKPDC